MAQAKANKKMGALAVELPECPVCLEAMSAPIFQCQSGHSLCSSCTKNLLPPICPICRQQMTQMRNWQLEDMIAKATVPCPNKSSGCVYTMISIEVENHVRECIFREMTCPLGLVFGRCSWSGKLKEIMDHFKASHQENCKIHLDTETDLGNFSTSNDDRFMYLTNFGKFLFILTIKIDTNQKMVYWVVQHIGSKKSAQQYTYEILVISKQDKRRQVKFTDHCYNDTYDINEIFRQAKCGVMPLNMLNHFIKDKHITIQISITKAQPMFRNKSNNENVQNKFKNDANKHNTQNKFRGNNPGPNNQNRPHVQNQFRGKSPGPHFKSKNSGPNQHKPGHKMSNKQHFQ